MAETLNSGNISTRLERIAELARKHPERRFASLHHVIDVAWLREAYRRTRKDGAVGIDGVSAEAYERGLEGNLESLLGRFRTGRYEAPPVRRAHIPKDGGRTRPIGIPTFEDKVLQRAVTMVLEALYEPAFHPGSYGFRPKRSAHDALQAVWDELHPKGGWVVEVDIRSFFDTLDHGVLRRFLDERVTDGVLRRMIDKWLKAGVLEAGSVRYPDEGTPQGGVISPILANIYLHHVLDVWFEQDVRPRLRGGARLVRYADDFVLMFREESDARKVFDVLPKRFGKYGLDLHPDKTRLLKFMPPRSGKDGGDDSGTFDFLGFTHFWGLSRKKKWAVVRKTMRARFTRALTRVRQWCRRNRHLPIPDQHRAISAKLRGHYGYFGITGNARALVHFAREVRRAWHFWLDRRSSRGSMPWERYATLLRARPLPTPRVVHSAYANRSAKP